MEINNIKISSQNDLCVAGISLTKVKIGDEKCLVNKPELEYSSTFADIIPYYDPINKLHNKLQNGKIRTLNLFSLDNMDEDSISGEIRSTMRESNLDSIEKLCETKRNHANSIIENIHAMGYESPSPIQSLSCFPIINGEDVMIQFKAGTGKTLAQVFYSLTSFDLENPSLQHIFLTSRFETSEQIYNLISSLIPNAKIAKCFEYRQLPGSFAQPRPQMYNEATISIKNAQIIVGTVVKTYDILNHYENEKIDFKSVKVFALDEFDILLEPRKPRLLPFQSLADKIKCILELLPEQTQRLFYSSCVTKISIEIARSLFRQNSEGVKSPFILLLEGN